jgi:hypothetical protein
MAVNTSPIFTLTPVIGVAQLSTADALRNSGSPISVITGNTNGTRITRVVIQSTGSQISNGMIRLFVTSNGSSMLYNETAVTTSVPSGSVVGFRSALEYTGERAIILPSGVSLKASTTVSETFNVIAEGGDY